MTKLHLLSVALLIATSGAAQTPSAAEPPLARPESDSPWRFELTTWVWLLAVQGDVGARGITADVNATFQEIVETADSIVAFSGRLEAGYERWGGFVDGYYSDLGVDDVSGPRGLANVDVRFEQGIIDFGLMYRLIDRELFASAEEDSRNFTVDAYAGGRYSVLEVKLEPANLLNRSQDKSWIDPIVGAKVVLPVAERWHLEVNGDVGGFGVESDFTWSATGLIGYSFRLFDAPVAVYAGYRAIGWDFTEGSGNSEFTWDVIEHGPLLGFGLRF